MPALPSSDKINGLLRGFKKRTPKGAEEKEDERRKGRRNSTKRRLNPGGEAGHVDMDKKNGPGSLETRIWFLPRIQPAARCVASRRPLAVSFRPMPLGPFWSVSVRRAVFLSQHGRGATRAAHTVLLDPYRKTLPGPASLFRWGRRISLNRQLRGHLRGRDP